jgi:hypothetical protein
MIEETYTPKRRGRPPLSTEDDVITDIVKPVEATVETTKRRRRPSVGGHAMKLGAPLRPGFQRRWANDEKNRLAELDQLGYDHVTESGIGNTDPGSRISRLVGTQANGEPLRAYLMETPDELFAEGVAEKDAHNRLIDEALIAGRDTTGQLVASETYGTGTIETRHSH